MFDRKNGFQIRIEQQKIHNIKEKRPFLYVIEGKYYRYKYLRITMIVICGQSLSVHPQSFNFIQTLPLLR